MPVSKDRPAAVPAAASGFALGFIVLFLAVYVLGTASSVVIPFVIAVFFWYLINALARRLSRISFGTLRLPRVICFALAIFFLIMGMWFVYELVMHNLEMVAQKVPEYQARFRTVIIPKLMTVLKMQEEQALKELLGYIDVGFVVGQLGALFTGIAGKTLVVFFYTGFLLFEQRFFGHKIKAVFESREGRERVTRILRNIDVNMQRYIGVKTFISALTGIATWLWLAYFDIDFNQFWGLLAFILNFLPYIGSLIAIIAPSAIALVQMGGDLGAAAPVIAGLAAIQLTLGSIIDPRMMGDSLNLSPICIILSLGAWGMIWGVPGMFLAIPILAICVITLSQFESTRPYAILLSKTGEIDRAYKGGA